MPENLQNIIDVYLVLLRIQKGNIMSRRSIHDATKRRNATTASHSQLLYLAIFPISRNISLASWRARTTEPTRANLFDRHNNNTARSWCWYQFAKEWQTPLPRNFIKKIPENVGKNNQNNSCYMVGHWYSKVRTSCFPEQESENWICVKSSSIHVDSFELQSGRRKIQRWRWIFLGENKIWKRKRRPAFLLYHLIRPDLVTRAYPKVSGVLKPWLIVCYR